MNFQDQINLLRAGEPPLPLMQGQATAQALRLRSQGLSYNTVAAVMATYHGYRLTGYAWRARCRRAGESPTPLLDGTARPAPRRKAAS